MMGMMPRPAEFFNKMNCYRYSGPTGIRNLRLNERR